MRLLAIDTALAACSAAVLDTAHRALNGGIIASESLPMIRGHAEARCPNAFFDKIGQTRDLEASLRRCARFSKAGFFPQKVWYWYRTPSTVRLLEAPA